ncbi:hypothetical protein [Dyadobacter sp. 3J3]|uniref:hypothetical protein n=1 Tax=Dyadobacter sp. 3J3 TaxID=2606600 RepID=UPI00135865A5|nr:hypothetical protein [Dyadobacter sp. 3J3]
MKLTRLLIFLITLGIMSACRKKDAFPDLAKQIEGRWNIYDAVIPASLEDSIYHYNPRDSAQVALIQVRKIDPLRVQISMSVKKQNGSIIFESDYEFELSRDFNNEGIILFDTYPGAAGGGYHINEKIFEISAVSRRNEQFTGKTAWFLAKR